MGKASRDLAAAYQWLANHMEDLKAGAYLLQL